MAIDTNSLRGYGHIVITGASGQLGSALVERLMGTDCKLTLMDLRPPSHPHEARCDFIECDLRDKDKLAGIRNGLADADALVHLASRIDSTTSVINNGAPSVDINLKGLFNLLEVLPSLKAVSFSSTYIVYDHAGSMPVKESHPTEPVNTYGACKLAAEKYLGAFSREFGIPAASLRFMGVYGPGTPISSKRAIPAFINNVFADEPPVLYGTGEERRNHLYIDDAVDSLILSLSNKKNGVFNIGGPEAVSNAELVETILAISGKELPVRFMEGDGRSFVVDITKAKEELGYAPGTTMKEGLTKQIEWHRSRGDI